MNVFLEMMLRSSLVMAVGLAGLWLLRRQPAAFRHWVLAAALVLAAAQPLLNSIAPALRMPATVTSVEIEGPVFDANFHADELVVVTAPRVAAIDWRRMLMIGWLAGTGISLSVMLLGAIWLSWLRAQLVQPAVLDRVRAAAPRERARV
ncbi:MAG: hypothetical protein K2Y23_10140 [Cyanobacteria bacterium]|nr:hypothetical protein [Cyanobacteriota bacterium]